MKFSRMFLFIALLIVSCTNQSSNSYNEYSEDGYEDGTYCAEIHYYYSNTGTSSTYTLEVEIEDNELVQIYWPNGGRLDNSHFYPPDISDGYASFTSDKGVDYKVNIIGDGGCNTTRGSLIDDLDEIEEEQDSWYYDDDDNNSYWSYDDDDDDDW